jgi:hypothetical protein
MTGDEMHRLVISAAVVTAMAVTTALAEERSSLLSGEYEVRLRFELPHAEDVAVSKTARICVTEDADTQGLIVLSDNNPLSRCPPSNIRRDGQSLTFDLICAGHNQAVARASFALRGDRFDGVIAMKMGGKNMTMTERQSGRRIGACSQVPRS